MKILLLGLTQQGIVEVISGPFGPPIIAMTADFDVKVNELSNDATFPLHIYRKLPVEQGIRWLKSALQEVLAKYQELRITDEDLDEPLDKEWEPLPLEYDNPQLQMAIKAVGDVVDKVRSDNGYTANLPEERDYVLGRLSALSSRLKEAASTSFAFLKRNGFEPLSMLVKRFGNAAIGLLATAAKEALREWLRQKGITFLDWL